MLKFCFYEKFTTAISVWGRGIIKIITRDVRKQTAKIATEQESSNTIEIPSTSTAAACQIRYFCLEKVSGKV